MNDGRIYFRRRRAEGGWEVGYRLPSGGERLIVGGLTSAEAEALLERLRQAGWATSRKKKEKS